MISSEVNGAVDPLRSALSRCCMHGFRPMWLIGDQPRRSCIEKYEYIRAIGHAKRGERPPAKVTLLAHGRQLTFARALLALDEAGKPIKLEP